MRKLKISLLTLFAVFYLVQNINLKEVSGLCGNNCRDVFRLEIENNTPGRFNQQTVTAPTVAPEENNNNVLGTGTSGDEKQIFVNLATQTLTAYQGDELILKTPVSTGYWNKTPTGVFTVWSKLRATRMTGGEGADYYDLPNVPYVMFFANSEVPQSTGFSLHGAYWHNNFGHPMSHGCVNMRIKDAAKLYYWIGLNVTKVTIFDNRI